MLVTNRGLCSLMALAGLMVQFGGTIASADEPVAGDDLARDRLSRVIAVLRLQPEAAGQSCLNALHEVHKTEDDIKALQNRSKDPDSALAQDVMETDYENGNEICGADATRVCTQSAAAADMQVACAALKRTPGSK